MSHTVELTPHLVAVQERRSDVAAKISSLLMPGLNVPLYTWCRGRQSLV